MPDEMPVFLTEHIYAATRADMKFGTSLTAARHHIENLLNAFSHAVCSRDAYALGALTRRVTVSRNEQTPSEESKAAKISDWFAHTDPGYSATYHDWHTSRTPLHSYGYIYGTPPSWAPSMALGRT